MSQRFPIHVDTAALDAKGLQDGHRLSDDDLKRLAEFFHQSGARRITINEATLLLDSVGSVVTAMEPEGEDIGNGSMWPVLRGHLQELRMNLNRESSMRMIRVVFLSKVVSLCFLEGSRAWDFGVQR